jgi:hypothetical protein
MTSRRSFLLLEVVLGLALLAGLGVSLVQLEAHSIRQFRRAQERGRVGNLVDELLWSWSESKVPVTLPASGQFSSSLRWRREIRPVRIAEGVICTQVSVIVDHMDAHGALSPVYRVDWLVPDLKPGGQHA